MKRFCYCFLLLIISSFISNTITGQTTIQGRVVSEENNEGLPWVNVSLLKASDSLFVKGTTTDEKGLYTLTVTEEGNYLIRFSFIGFESRMIQVQASGKEVETGATLLKPSASMLGSVEVAAKKPMYLYENVWGIKPNVHITLS